MKVSASPEGRFAKLVEEFFLERLIRQRNSSPQTVAAYRDCFRLLFEFARDHWNNFPQTAWCWPISMPHGYSRFWITSRRNGRTRFGAAMRVWRLYGHSCISPLSRTPESLALIHRSLAIPTKRCSRTLMGFLSREEVQAIIDAPDSSTWVGQRDQVFWATLYNTGARVSEAVGIKVADVVLEGSPSIHLRGKGRKDRTIPIWPATAAQIRRWLPRIDPSLGKPLFPAATGGHLTRSAITDRLKRATKTATTKCASLAGRNISPHTVRHYLPFRIMSASGTGLSFRSMIMGTIINALVNPNDIVLSQPQAAHEGGKTAGAGIVIDFSSHVRIAGEPRR